MLQRLYIKDFAIVDELEILFGSGFQVITGETGAGKSILVGAIGLLCGERGTTDIIRTGAHKAVMEAEFSFSNDLLPKEILENPDIDLADNVLILRREINDRGISRAFVNDTPITIGKLAGLSDLLVDLHGQHQHQRLLHPETHIEYLDAYGQLHEVIAKYTKALTNFRQHIQQLESLKNSHHSIQEKQDLFRFQIDELKKANLSNDEYSALEQERKILENSEMLFEKARLIAEILYNSDNSVLKSVSDAYSDLKHIAAIDESFTALVQNLEAARVSVEEVGLACEQYCANLEFDPDRLEEIRSRQAELDWLTKKYQMQSVDDLIEHLGQLEDQVAGLENFTEDIAKLEKLIEQDRNELLKTAAYLSEQRKLAAAYFSDKINPLLHSVGLQNARFEIHFDMQESNKGEIDIDGHRILLNDNGMDIVEFLVGLNVGEPVKPLHKVASGGEVSRIMLCIKSLLADGDKIETLVFDEIDSGISGKFAQIVGKKMREMARKHQLIVITHLPQIAAQGDAHYSVNKFESNGRTKVLVDRLTEEQRVEDIAKLLGGEIISNTSKANARELLAELKE